MANNEPKWLFSNYGFIKDFKISKYSIRLLLIPETIGAIGYIKKI